VKTTSLLIFLLFLVAVVLGQTKVITGAKHVIALAIPKNWIQIPSKQPPLLLKPDVNVSANTYMYVNARDYNTSPNIESWIRDDAEAFVSKHPGTQVQEMLFPLPNFAYADYQTGRYKIIIYTCDSGLKQAILVVECKNTIVTLLLSTVDNDEFTKYLPSFLELARSARISARDVKN